MAAYPIVSWGVVLLLGGAALFVYKPDLVKKVLPSSDVVTESATSASKTVNKRQKSKKPKAVQDVIDAATNTVQSSSDDTKSKKKRKISVPTGQTVTATTAEGETKELPRDDNKDIDDKTFAQQLAKAQSGTKLQSSAQQKASAPKRTGAATLQPKKSEDILSTAELSSTTGQDADDDLSSVESPQQKPASGRDISDMLEPSAAAPTTLRLTNVSDEQKKPKQAPKQFEQVQTKKKRNEQARREEQKRLREESDRIHEQKKQEQLRRARMAAGTSNQTKANTFTSNAWQNKPSTGGNTGSGVVPLLDTFEPSSSKSKIPTSIQTASLSTAESSNNVNALKSDLGRDMVGALGASGREAGTNGNSAGNMSEEEQLQKLRDQEQDDAWEPVTKKKSKKTKAENDTSSDASFPVSQPIQQKTEQASKKAPAPKTNGAAKSKDIGNRFDIITPVNMGGLQDDEWAA